MGKKSKRNKTNSGGSVRKATRYISDVYRTVSGLMDGKHTNWEKILKVESEYCHLDTFSDDPVDDLFVLHAFGIAFATMFGRTTDASLQGEICMERAIHYCERAKARMEDANANDRPQIQKDSKSEIGMYLALLYSAEGAGRDMEKAISSHRWFLEDCNRHQVKAQYVLSLSNNFNRFDKFEYIIEVLEGSIDTMETLEDKVQAETILIRAYIGCGEFLKAKAADEKCRSTNGNDWLADLQSGKIEAGLCNYKAAIPHFRKGVVELQKQEYDGDKLSGTRGICSMDLATTLLRHSTDNEAEAFAIFQEELDRYVDPLGKETILFKMGTWYRKLNKWDQSIKARRVDPLRREKILFQMGEWYRKLHQWDQSIEALHQLCLSATRPDSAMLPQANQAMAQTYLEQYCTDTTLDIAQRTEILRHATEHSNQVDEVSTKMHLTQAQLFYFNVDKQQAYHHLELYLDARLAACKLTCYTCKQRVRPGSVPFTCASCGVASYCGRRHQKMTWKNERICHRVLCPLLGYWRVSKKKRKKRHGFTNEDRHRREYERVFDTFFESICPHMKLPANNPSYTMKN